MSATHNRIDSLADILNGQKTLSRLATASLQSPVQGLGVSAQYVTTPPGRNLERSPTVVNRHYDALLNGDDMFAAESPDCLIGQAWDKTPAAQVSCSPFNRLPPELVYLIALEATRKKQSFATTFSHVDRYFRDVALNAPLLWSNLDIDRSLEHLSLYIERSKGVPLEMELSLCNFATVEWSRGNKRFRDAVHCLKATNALSRVRAVKAMNPRAWMAETEWVLQVILSESLPMLASVEIGISGNARGPIQLNVGGYQKHEVQEASLRSVLSSDIRMFASEKLRTLRLARMVAMDIGAFTSALQAAPNLQSLALEDGANFSITGRQLPADLRAPLHHLQELTLSEIDSDTVSIMAQVVDPGYPTITSFRYFGRVYGTTPPPVTHFPLPVRFLERIRTLEVTDLRLRAGQWRVAFSGMPELQTFHSERSGLCPSDLACLRIPLVDGKSAKVVGRTACPVLEDITLNYQLFLDTGVIREIVESRHRAPHVKSIRSLALRAWDHQHVQQSDLLVIKELVGITNLWLLTSPKRCAYSEDSDEE